MMDFLLQEEGKTVCRTAIVEATDLAEAIAATEKLLEGRTYYIHNAGLAADWDIKPGIRPDPIGWDEDDLQNWSWETA